MVAASALAVASCAWCGAREDTYVERNVTGVERRAVKAAPVRTTQAGRSAKPPVAVKEADVAYRPAGRPPEAGDAHTMAETEAGCTNVDECAFVLKAMVADPQRSWIGRPAPPAVFANGVRLFAYRSLRPSLACVELAAATAEVQAGITTFGGPVPGVSPQRAARVRSLSVEVGDELHMESARRCQDQPRIGAGSARPGDAKSR